MAIDKKVTNKLLKMKKKLINKANSSKFNPMSTKELSKIVGGILDTGTSSDKPIQSGKYSSGNQQCDDTRVCITSC